MEDKTTYTVEITKRRSWYNFPWSVWLLTDGKAINEVTFTQAGAKRWAARKAKSLERQKQQKPENETYTYQIEV